MGRWRLGVEKRRRGLRRNWDGGFICGIGRVGLVRLCRRGEKRSGRSGLIGVVAQAQAASIA